MQHKYSSLLRVPICYTQGKFKKKFFGLLTKYHNSFDTVCFFNTWSHDVINLKKVSENLNLLKPVMEETKKLGFKVGINNLSTLGHHEEIPDELMSNMDLMVASDGAIKKGVLCATSKKTLDYIYELYTLIAKSGAEIIYADDDLDYNAHCYCENCLNEFDNSANLTRVKLLEKFESENLEERKSLRLAWLEFYRKKLRKIFSIIEKAVHNVNKNITIGFMPCNVGSSGMGTESWANDLKGERDTVLCRPGGGLYTDHSPERVMEKANNIAREIRYLPDFSSAQSEIENFPCQSLRKSTKFTQLEALTYLAVGCSGVTWNILAWDQCDLSEAEKYFATAKKIAPFAEKLVDTFGRNAPIGIGSYWDENSAVNIGTKNWHNNIIAVDEFFKIGLPACYETKNISVFIMNAQIAKNLTDSQILTHLESGVFMDAEAAEILNCRGFAELTGFKALNRYTKNAAEMNLNHEFNKGFDENVRNIRLEFSLYGHPEFGKTDPAYTIEKTNDKAEYLTKLISYDGKKYGYACGVFENNLGGRVCVSGYAPFNWCYNLARNTQIKNIFSWISKQQMPAYIDSFDKIALWYRKTTDWQNGVIFSNFSLEDCIKLKIRVLSQSSECIAFIFDGKKTSEYKLKIKSTKSAYGTVTIPWLPSFSVGFITYK